MSDSQKKTSLVLNKVNQRNQMSALMIAVDMGHVEAIKLFIHHTQTDVNIIDAKDESAISIASKRGYLRSLKLLLRCPTLASISLKT